MQVPLLDIKQQNSEIYDDLKDGFDRIFCSGQFILGPEVEAFERNFAALIGAKHGIGVSSGTDALLLALMVLEIGPGDEVISPAYSFFATASCISRLGATAVWCDTSADDFNIDTARIEDLISERTKIIIPVHLFGQAAAMDNILNICRKKNIHIIEDCAQAAGARFDGQQVGGFGTFGCYSFFPSKNLGGFGDAGMLVTNDDELATKARILRMHGMSKQYHHDYLGGNFRIDALQAAMLNTKMSHMADYIERRRSNAAYYSDAMSKIDGVGFDESCAIILPVEKQRNFHTFNQYTLRLKSGKRDELKRFLDEKNIGCQIYYPIPLSDQKCFINNSKGKENITVAKQLALEALSIPMFPELSSGQMDYVIDSIAKFLKRL
ncbi:MAG: DegT/DnrJ/EryC1/StrS family aminotransferase [Puniceicoccales bacterium]|jgi:dTDP-4-amino-4,6-dideoxygalactose transaminase|nr:DegT/DnrJ/EryC1/StrS family aminotransferase [Puniceicoccales bacterium]